MSKHNESSIHLSVGQLTLAAEQSRELPELGHVESLEDLALVAGTVT